MTINFTKILGSGNDFVIIKGLKVARSHGLKGLARRMCDRKYGIGADGLLVLESSRRADVRMRIFNADGTEAEMCGNGARCAAYYLGKKSARLETKAGVIESKLNAGEVKIKLTLPQVVKLDVPIKINSRSLKVNFINIGVPHVVIFVRGLDKIDVVGLGRQVRFHNKFAPRGTNANFVEVVNKKSIKVRTYERGVEDETLACGTGTAASALIFALKTGASKKVWVITKSGEVLKVYFERNKDKFSNVWLEGKVKLAYKGVYHV